MSRRLVAALALLLSLSVGCSRQPSESPSQSAVPLKIGYSQLRISLPIFVAQDKGIFSKHGIQAQLQVYDTAQPMMQALVEGKLDIAGYTALPITFTAMIRSKTPLYFTTLMIEDQQHRISYLLRPRTPPGAKAAIASISDLKGKKIGILPTIAYKSWLGVILKANGMDPSKDVVIQQIEPTQEAAALKSGGVDALFTNDPVATAAIASGIAELVSDTVECPKYIQDPFPFGSFNVRKQWADAHTDEFKRLIAAIDEAVAFVNANPVEAKQFLKSYLPQQFASQVERYPDARYFSSSEANAGIFTEHAKKSLEMGIIPEAIDLTGLIISGNR